MKHALKALTGKYIVGGDRCTRTVEVYLARNSYGNATSSHAETIIQSDFKANRGEFGTSSG